MGSNSNQTDQSQNANSTSNQPNYRRIEIPDAKQPTDYTYTERRAEIYQMMRRQKSPNLEQTQTQLANRYGVCQQQISKDLDRIRESLNAYYGDDVKLRLDMLFETGIEDLLEAGETYKAMQVAEMLADYMFETGGLDRVPDEHDVSVSGQMAHAHAHTEADDTGFLTEQSAAHFEALTQEADAATAPNTAGAGDDAHTTVNPDTANDPPEDIPVHADGDDATDVDHDET